MIDLLQFNRVFIKYGIPDFYILCIGSGPIFAFNFAITVLPMLVLFQKLTPEHVESTMMALSASIMNLANGFTGAMLGAFVNHNFIGITNDNVATKFNICIYITIAGTIYQTLLIPMIPTRSEIDETIKKQQEEKEMDSAYSGTQGSEKGE
jgi:hypothetical protein